MAKRNGSHTNRQSVVISTRINRNKRKAFAKISEELGLTSANLALNLILDFIDNPSRIKDEDLKSTMAAIQTIRDMNNRIEHLETLAEASGIPDLSKAVSDLKNDTTKVLEKLGGVAGMGEMEGGAGRG